MLRIACISDTHDIHYPVLPEVDAVIHAGDITLSGSPDETYRFLQWFNGLPIKHKIFIGGNHDKFLERYYGAIMGDFPKVTMLLDSSYDLEGYKVWGSPYSTTFMNWYFMKDPDEMEEHWAKIPSDADIVVTHGPAYGIRDNVRSGAEHLGDRALLERLKVVAPEYHICGHIHGGRGVDTWGPVCINAAVLNEKYKPYDYDPIVIELPRKQPETTECQLSARRQDVRDAL